LKKLLELFGLQVQRLAAIEGGKVNPLARLVLEPQAQSLLEELSKGNPLPGGLGLGLPIQLIVYAKRGLHLSTIAICQICHIDSDWTHPDIGPSLWGVSQVAGLKSQV
jgi:hypothetical protein